MHTALNYHVLKGEGLLSSPRYTRKYDKIECVSSSDNFLLFRIPAIEKSTSEVFIANKNACQNMLFVIFINSAKSLYQLTQIPIYHYL